MISVVFCQTFTREIRLDAAAADWGRLVALPLANELNILPLQMDERGEGNEKSLKSTRMANDPAWGEY